MAKGITVTAIRITACRLLILTCLWIWSCQRPLSPQADKCAYPAVSPGPLHLLMGNPSGARADTNQANNYLMEKPRYALSYNRSKLHANWVAWHLTGGDLGPAARQDDFRPEAYFRDIVRVTRPAHAIPQRIVLRVKSETAPYLVTRPIHASQQLTGSQAAYALFEYSLIPNFEFVGEILRLADAAEILEPEDLRKMFAVKTASMGLAYRERPGSGQ